MSFASRRGSCARPAGPCYQDMKSFDINHPHHSLVPNPTVHTRACRGGWRDVMINFCITKDDGLHICELQIAHKQMMTARKGLPGHAVYNRVRDALAHTVSLIQIQSRRPRPSRLPSH